MLDVKAITEKRYKHLKFIRLALKRNKVCKSACTKSDVEFLILFWYYLATWFSIQKAEFHHRRVGHIRRAGLTTALDRFFRTDKFYDQCIKSCEIHFKKRKKITSWINVSFFSQDMCDRNKNNSKQQSQPSRDRNDYLWHYQISDPAEVFRFRSAR